ncbi:MAG: aminodeoxychorismate/anthranilate synthase component II, partial [Pseudomonadota bacterium]
MLLVIDNYDSFTFNLVHYAQELGAETVVVRNDEISVGQALSSGAKAILLSPGPCTPNEAGICLDLIRQAPDDLPMLGICLGQQAMGQAFGGKVIRAKEIM